MNICSASTKSDLFSKNIYMTPPQYAINTTVCSSDQISEKGGARLLPRAGGVLIMSCMALRGTHWLVDMVVLRLTTHPFRDGAPWGRATVYP